MKKLILFIACILILPHFIRARGSADSERQYLSELETSFNRILLAVEADEMTSLEGRIVLEELRNRYNKSYSDQYGIMEALIDQLDESLISFSDAQYHFSLLQTGRLMEYRRERNKSKPTLNRSGTRDNDDSDERGNHNDQGQQQGSGKEGENGPND